MAPDDFCHLLQKADGSCSTDFKTTRSREQVIRVFEEFVQGDAEVLVSVRSQNPEMLGSLIPRGAPRSGHLTQQPSLRDPHPSVYRTALLLLTTILGCVPRGGLRLPHHGVCQAKHASQSSS